MEPNNADIDADIVDYLLGDYEDGVNDSGAHFLSNIKVQPTDLGLSNTDSSSSSSSSSSSGGGGGGGGGSSSRGRGRHGYTSGYG